MTRTTSALFILSVLIPVIYCEYVCEERDYGTESIVCVCNSTHCGTIEQPQDDSEHRLDVFQYTTTKSGKRLHMSTLKFHPCVFRGKKQIGHYLADESISYQEILAFGCALTDGAGYLVKSLSEDTQENLLKSYFGDTGLQYTFLRVPVASTDASISNYTYDDYADDVELTHFNLTDEEYLYKIPIIKRANELNGEPVKLFGDTWFSPQWMMGHVEDGDYWTIKPEYFEVWARYYEKFLDAYKEEGLNFWGLAQQNEPNSAIQQHSLWSMGWTKEQLIEWLVGYLGPILSENYDDLNILIMNDERGVLEEYADAFYGNETASSYVTGASVHWLTDQQTSPYILDRVQNKYPDKFILYTESNLVPGIRPGPYVVLGSWEGAHIYISDIISVLNHYSIGWIDWLYAVDPEGGPSWRDSFADAPIIVNTTADEFYRQPTYYALAHVSHFVPPGSVRIHLTVSKNKDKELQSIAFLKPSGSIVLILYNPYEEKIEVAIDSGDDRGSVVTVLEENSINTFVYHK